MKILSPAFADQDLIPAKFTCEGQNISPEISWQDAPQNTKSFALIIDDPDAPAGVWTHWVLYNIPANVSSLAENTAKFSDGTEIGMNSWSKQEYGGPCPPSGEHRYFFKLFALDTTLKFTFVPTSELLQKAMTGHVLASAAFMGRYSKH